MSIKRYALPIKGVSRWVRHDDHVAEVERLTALLKESDDERVALKEHYPKLRSQLAAARAERDGLAKALADAIECVESWSAYADPYFQQKHDLAGDLARLRAALAALPTAPTPEYEPLSDEQRRRNVAAAVSGLPTPPKEAP